MPGKVKLQDQKIEEYWTGSEIKEMRDKMLSGQTVDRCQSCYEEEKNLGFSMRTQSLRDYRFLSDKHYYQLVKHHGYLSDRFPRRLELHLGNLCNLKCLTCRPQDSSLFLTEDKILKISNHSQKDYQINAKKINAIFESISDHPLDILDLRGGETMLMPLIKKVLLGLPTTSKINTLRIQTNATILDEDWKKIFSKFPSIEIMLSIDAFDSANHYIRYPSDWKSIESNISYLKTLSNIKKMFVHCSVSNLNFSLLPRLIDWCQDNDLYFHYSVIKTPKYYHYTNLPKTVFVDACEKLKNYDQVKDLSNGNSDTTLWKDFCRIISLRDSHRKNSIFEILPQLKEFWINQ